MRLNGAGVIALTGLTQMKFMTEWIWSSTTSDNMSVIISLRQTDRQTDTEKEIDCIFTSAKEVMYLSVFVCLSVC